MGKSKETVIKEIFSQLLPKGESMSSVDKSRIAALTRNKDASTDDILAVVRVVFPPSKYDNAFYRRAKETIERALR